MTLMKLNRYALPAIAASFLAFPASAVQPIAEKPGVSGYFQLGVGMVNVESNLLATTIGVDLGDDTTDDLVAEADSEVSAIPLLGLSVTYTFENKSTEIFFGSSIEDFVRFDFASRAGLRQSAGKVGIFELSAVATPLATEVWEDPYVTGTARDETDRTADGARIEWGSIFGSGFDLQVSSREIDIDDERSGDALVAATTITAGEQGLLDRNGDMDVVKIVYNWQIEEGRILSIGLRSFDNDLDGEAMAHDGSALELTYFARLNATKRMAVNFSVGTFEHDEENPIYDEEDEADIAGLTVTFFASDPFGYKGWVGNAGFAFGEEDHEIDFYDSKAVMVSVGMLRRF
jgi:hypothetical protein